MVLPHSQGRMLVVKVGGLGKDETGRAGKDEILKELALHPVAFRSDSVDNGELLGDCVEPSELNVRENHSGVFLSM